MTPEAVNARADELYRAECERTHGKPTLFGMCRVTVRLALECGGRVSTPRDVEALARALFSEAYDQHPHMQKLWLAVMTSAAKLEQSAWDKRQGVGG
jgi:hypothetical protein